MVFEKGTLVIKLEKYRGVSNTVNENKHLETFPNDGRTSRGSNMFKLVGKTWMCEKIFLNGGTEGS